MTRIAISRRIPRPFKEVWNAWAVPWKLVVMEAGRVARATLSTADTASPSAMPGRRLNERVTEGSWPRWFTRSGPTPGVSRATAESGTDNPEEDRTYNRESAAGSVWNFGRSSRMTLYVLLGAKMVEICRAP